MIRNSAVSALERRIQFVRRLRRRRGEPSRNPLALNKTLMWWIVRSARDVNVAPTAHYSRHRARDCSIHLAVYNSAAVRTQHPAGEIRGVVVDLDVEAAGVSFLSAWERIRMQPPF